MSAEIRKAGAFPWDETMAFGFGVLRLSSSDFWMMTPREIASAMRAHGAARAEPPARAELDRLLAAFPDEG